MHTYIYVHTLASYTHVQDRLIITRYYVDLPATPVLVSQLVRELKPYYLATSDRFPPSHPTKMEEPQTAVSPLLGLISVAY